MINENHPIKVFERYHRKQNWELLQAQLWLTGRLLLKAIKYALMVSLVASIIIWINGILQYRGY